MYLKRLELVGFKSFAQKAVFDFPTGIAVIVGPNGSGKSNVIDAIRWLLGEREAKNLRGLKADDLIFAGTPKQGRLGMAQASVHFDNSSGFFPVEFAEVAITRKISRDGISQYSLNKAETRLKDVVDFFAQSRLGTKGFTIINQGNGDLFVRAAPKERREMIEEILGLRQFQLKKHDAQLKLKNTKINLDKVRAMIEEISPHLRLLRRQTAKWAKRLDVEKELKETEDRYFSAKIKEVESQFVDFEPQIKSLDRQIDEKLKELKKLQAGLSLVENSQPQQRQDFQLFKKQQTDLLSRRSTFQKELGRLEVKMEFLASENKIAVKETELLVLIRDIREAIKSLLSEEDIGRLRKALGNLAEKIDSLLKSDSKSLESQRNYLEESRKKLCDDLSSIDDELIRLENSEKELAKHLEDFNLVFRKSFEAVELKKDEISNLENQKNKLILEKERFDIKWQDLENRASQINRKLEEFKNIILEPAADLDLESLERKMFKLRTELASIGEIDQALIKETETIEARYQFLSTQLDDLTKAFEDLNNLIKELDQRVHSEFSQAMNSINEEFNKFFRLMFGGGKAKLVLSKPVLAGDESLAEAFNEIEKIEKAEEAEEFAGVDINLSLPRKNVRGLDMLSGGEKSLVSIAVLFALVSVSPPPFLVLDEVDAALDERNSKRFAELVKEFAQKTQFIIVTHNRSTMEAADVLYGVTMGDDGISRILSLKLESS